MADVGEYISSEYPPEKLQKQIQFNVKMKDKEDQGQKQNILTISGPFSFKPQNPQSHYSDG